ncbi:MAG: hypothetical protein MEQ74_03975 [Paracoccus sp.]|nr:hypothetical protein [Paracoccus sp. (in: a-proteobacteria)]
MADAIDRYLTAGTALPWVWGESDCTIWVADWCVLHFGFDPAASFRGKYRDSDGAARLTASGLAATIAPHMAPLRVTDPPLRGDVGIIDIRGCEVAAIWTGRRWAFRTPRGLGECPARALISWGN